MNGTFADIVAVNYDEIRRNFKAGLKERGYDWDEDLLNDAFISCNSALKNKDISKTEAIKYFWTSYINKFKTKQSKKKPEESIEDHDVDLICPVYNDSIDKIYNIFLEAVQDEYGLRKAYIWELYVCEGKSAKEIREMGFDDVDNFAYFTRKVKRFLKRFISENPDLKELVKNRFETI